VVGSPSLRTISAQQTSVSTAQALSSPTWRQPNWNGDVTLWPNKRAPENTVSEVHGQRTTSVTPPCVLAAAAARRDVTVRSVNPNRRSTITAKCAACTREYAVPTERNKEGNNLHVHPKVGSRRAAEVHRVGNIQVQLVGDEPQPRGVREVQSERVNLITKCTVIQLKESFTKHQAKTAGVVSTTGT
jgi:hypothetical protein